MRKKMYIFLISFCLVSVLLLYPFSTLLKDFISAAPLIGQGKEITFSEPAMMFLLGSGLIGMAVFAKKLRKKIKNL